MRYKKILLCMPPLPGNYGSQASPPISIGYLSEVLTENNIDHEVIDMSLGYNLQDLRKKIKQVNPDLIGFTIFGFRHDVPYSLISSIKSSNYDIIVGGPHSSTMGKKVLEETDANYAIKYEGEQLLVDLCKGLPLNKIDSLIYRKNGEIIENPHKFFLDVTNLPFPKYKKFELDKYLRRRIRILTSRGCPYNCIFCSIKKTIGSQIRMKDAKSTVEEVRYWCNLGYRDIDFIDDLFIFDKKRVLDICEGIQKLGIKGLKLTIGNGVRADKIDIEILKKMKETGFTGFSMGVEVGNNKMLKAIKKGETIEQIENAIKLSTRLGFDVSLFFIVGLPQETISDVKDSINLALKYPVNNAYFYNAVPFPGTELYDYLKKNNLFVVKAPDYLNTMAHFDNPIFITPQLSLEEKKEMLKLTKKVENEILRRTFVRKLKKFGILSIIVSHIVFLKPVHKTFQKLSVNSSLSKKIMIYIINRFNLKMMESVR